ncbi:MAG: PQQ-dependent sugar dehydrogenase [Bryobacteraceae bacterium]|nr:PQQ-dependent sugar dehydrogenase [Bryobacteraceae bacterium]
MRLGTLLLLLLSLTAAAQQTEWPRLRPVLVAGGFDRPVDIQSPRDGTWRLFIVEQTGRIKVMENLEVRPEPFLDLRSKVISGGERGLLGLAFPPNFKEKRHFYVNYTEGRGAPDLRTVVARYRVSASDPNRADPESEERILVIDQPFDNHNAGQLAFGPDGYLYIGTGDGGSGGDPLRAGQNPLTLLGKMLRIDVESGVTPYTIPPDNPFVGNPAVLDAIWSLGLRNPWRYSFDRHTGDLYIADVGQNRREEINFEPTGSPGGVNYGWAIVEGTTCFVPGCNLAAFTAPVFDYTQNGPQSVTGGYVYRGWAHDEWQGTYFFGDFTSGRFWGLRREGSQWSAQELLRLAGWNISAFGEDEDGEILFARFRPAGNGEIWKLAAEQPVTKPWLVVNAASGEAGVSPGARTNVYGWGISNSTGFVNAPGRTAAELDGVKVWFGDIAAGIISVLNFGGSEAVVVEAPGGIGALETVDVTIERNGVRGATVSAEVRRAQPALFAGLPPEALEGGRLLFFGTGFGALTADGQCAEQVVAVIDGQRTDTLFCRPSEVMGGVYELGVRRPDGVSGAVPVGITAGGAESPVVTMTLP